MRLMQLYRRLFSQEIVCCCSNLRVAVCYCSFSNATLLQIRIMWVKCHATATMSVFFFFFNTKCHVIVTATASPPYFCSFLGTRHAISDPLLYWSRWSRLNDWCFSTPQWLSQHWLIQQLLLCSDWPGRRGRGRSLASLSVTIPQ